MPQVIVTDVRYRTAMAVIRPLAEAGYRVIAVQAKAESPAEPAAFGCRSVSERLLLDCSVKDDRYADELYELCCRCDHPVLFPIGADTLAMLSRNRERFAAVCDFLVSPAEVLDAANDKRTVAQVADSLGIPIPKEHLGIPDSYPVIIKPRCGEKLGLHAEQRYCRADDAESFQKALAKMQAFDPQPVVQTYITGDAVGVCVVMDRQHRAVSVICHKRIREYPITGGPSACCVSIYDEKLVEQSIQLLQALDFTGIAMVEYKGGHLLEINPRIWGSFPLTEKAKSHFALNYVLAAQGNSSGMPDRSYVRGKRMRFVLNDTLATLSYLRHGQIKTGLIGILDLFRAGDALFCFRDQKPFWRYLSQTIRKRGHE